MTLFVFSKTVITTSQHVLPL